MAEIVVTTEVGAPAQRVWDALVDFDRQGEWILGTRVRGLPGQGVGRRVEAFTGVGKVGFLDTMVVRVWEPPRRCVVRHTGRVVRGNGSFEVEDLGTGRARVVISEWVDLPFGLLGQLGWLVAGPALRLGFAASLRRFARQVADQGAPAS